MREIKFRVWDSEYKRFRDILLDHSIRRLNNNDFEDRFVFSQYTGRKDKNGKKIYEGDFLARESFWSVRIEWEDTAFMVRDLDKVRYNNLCFNWYLKSFDCSEWEVIGNIYENPELQNK